MVEIVGTQAQCTEANLSIHRTMRSETDPAKRRYELVSQFELVACSSWGLIPLLLAHQAVNCLQMSLDLVSLIAAMSLCTLLADSGSVFFEPNLVFMRIAIFTHEG